MTETKTTMPPLVISPESSPITASASRSPFLYFDHRSMLPRGPIPSPVYNLDDLGLGRAVAIVVEYIGLPDILHYSGSPVTPFIERDIEHKYRRHKLFPLIRRSTMVPLLFSSLYYCWNCRKFAPFITYGGTCVECIENDVCKGCRSVHLKNNLCAYYCPGCNTQMSLPRWTMIYYRGQNYIFCDTCRAKIVSLYDVRDINKRTCRCVDMDNYSIKFSGYYTYAHECNTNPHPQMDYDDIIMYISYGYVW